MIQEGMNVHGSMLATLNKEDGTVEVIKKDNLIVAVGFDFICNAIAATTSRPSAMTHIAVGTGDTNTPNLKDTSLETELTRQSATYTHQAGTKVFTLKTTFAPGKATGRIVEAGVINAATGGILFDRVTFLEINKGQCDSLTVQFTFTLS